MLDVRPLALDGLFELRPERFSDERGFFSEVWSKRDFQEAGISVEFVQDNHSLSRTAGVIRGLHYQLPPAAQHKLVRVTRGRIFDVAVDIRRSSENFGRWAGLEISAKTWNQLLIPPGFAHGYLTLEPDTEVQYKVSAAYNPERERAILWSDPDLGVEWPLAGLVPLVSGRDGSAPPMSRAELFA